MRRHFDEPAIAKLGVALSIGELPPLEWRDDYNKLFYDMRHCTELTNVKRWPRMTKDCFSRHRGLLEYGHIVMCAAYNADSLPKGAIDYLLHIFPFRQGATGVAPISRVLRNVSVLGDRTEQCIRVIIQAAGRMRCLPAMFDDPVGMEVRIVCSDYWMATMHAALQCFDSWQVGKNDMDAIAYTMMSSLRRMSPCEHKKIVFILERICALADTSNGREHNHIVTTVEQIARNLLGRDDNKDMQTILFSIMARCWQQYPHRFHPGY